MPARLPKSNKVTKAGENLPLGTNILALAPGRYSVDGVGPSDWAGMNLPIPTWHYEIIVYASENKPGEMHNYKVITVFPSYANNIYINRMGYEGNWTGWVRLATATPPEEYLLPLESGWSGDGYYCMDDFGFMHISGSFTVNTEPNGWATIASLPFGYRPKNAWRTMSVSAATGNPVYVAIYPNGLVQALMPSGEQSVDVCANFLSK